MTAPEPPSGLLCGPPCCSWSIARGKGDHGPRVIRDRANLWGFLSVSIREMFQLLDGNALLGFGLHALLLLQISGGCGVLEHPAEPSQPHAASIWRLPLVALLRSLPGFQQYECAQGLLGAVSAKRTGLLVLNIPDLLYLIEFGLMRSALTCLTVSLSDVMTRAIIALQH